jgi:hypothetical protein
LSSLFGVTPAAAKSNEIAGHWAKPQLQSWVDKGYLQADGNGNIRPDEPVTRGAFIQLLNRSFGFTEQGDRTAADIDPASPDYAQAAIALHEGYISGYEDGTIRPSAELTRLEAASMLARALKLDSADSADILNVYRDASRIPAWSKPAVAAIVSKGIMAGFPDRSLQLGNRMTRAEAVVLLERARQAKYAAIYDTAGDYGPDFGELSLEGDVFIDAAGVTLRNAVISGNLILGESIGDGDVNLDRVTVKGDTLVHGGGAHSIHFKDSVIVSIRINKATGDVRFVVDGSTTVKQVNVQSPAILDNSQATNGGILSVRLEDRLAAGSKVSLLGNFDSVEVAAQSVSVDVPSGTINNLNVAPAAGGSQLNLGPSAVVTNLLLKAPLTTTGQGKIENATIEKGAEGSTFEREPAKSEGEGAKPAPTPQPAPAPTPSPSPAPSPAPSPSPMDPPVLTADRTDNDSSHPIEITFAANPRWENAITGVKAGSAVIDYTVFPGYIRIPSGVLEAGNHLLTVTATGYRDAQVNQPILRTPPTVTGSVYGSDLTIRFADDADWRGAIAQVLVNDADPGSDRVNVAAGEIAVNWSGKPDGNYTVTILASGYTPVSVTIAYTAAPSPIPTNGLLMWLKFDETSGTIAADSSGNGRDGVLLNGTSWSADGKYGGSASFDGVDDSIVLANGNLYLTGDFSIGVWVKLAPGIDGSDAIVGQTGQDINFYDAKVRLFSLSESGSPDRIVAATAVAADEWTHIAITRSAGILKLYVNGVLDQTASVAWTGAFKPMLAGYGNTGHLEGKLDDLVLYGRALGNEEILQLYTHGES